MNELSIKYTNNRVDSFVFFIQCCWFCFALFFSSFVHFLHFSHSFSLVFSCFRCSAFVNIGIWYNAIKVICSVCSVLHLIYHKFTVYFSAFFLLSLHISPAFFFVAVFSVVFIIFKYIKCEFVYIYSNRNVDEVDHILKYT